MVPVGREVKSVQNVRSGTENKKLIAEKAPRAKKIKCKTTKMFLQLKKIFLVKKASLF